MKKILAAAVLLTAMFAAQNANAQLKELTQAELYEKVLNIYDEPIDDKPCVVLFYSPYCQYSKQMAKNLTAVSQQLKNKIHFYQVNVFNIDDYTMRYCEIEGTPTTGLFYNNERYIVGGVFSASDLREELEDFLEEMVE